MRQRLAVAAAVALGLGACAGLDASVKPRAPVPGAVSGGTLRVGILEPESIDPALAHEPNGELVVRAMCEPVVEVDAGTGRVHGGITKHAVFEEEGSGATFTMLGGLRFSDGSKVSVADVRASISRVASDTLGSPLAGELSSIGGFAEVHGDVRVEDDGARSLLSGVYQVTNRVFGVYVTRPDPEFVMRLSRPWAAIVPKDGADSVDFGDRPVCVGPYRLASPWKPGQSEIRLERNEHYRPQNAALTNGGRGYPDAIVFRIYPDHAAASQAFAAGEVDVTAVRGAPVGADVDGGRIVTAATSSMEYIGLPNSVAPFSNPIVRLAFSVALDRQALLAKLGRSDRQVASTLLPPTMPETVLAAPECARAVPATADVPRAKELLTQAGVRVEGMQLKLYFNDEPGAGNRELMESVADTWRAAFGVHPVLVPLSWDDYRKTGIAGNGFDGPFRASWSTTTPSPIAFMRPLFSSGSIGETNLSRFSEPRFERPFEFDVTKVVDDDARFGHEESLHSYLCSQMPMVPVWSATQSYAVRDTVGAADGALQRRGDGALNIRELYLRRR